MPYIRETLASIYDQTYRDWEIIVWDNGSTDGTLEELKKWIPGKLPGKIVRDRPLSLGRSLAALVEMASTDLCARIDADDLCHPERLEKQVAFMRENPQVGLLGTRFERVDPEGKPLSLVLNSPYDDADLRWNLRWGNGICHPSVMFRRSAVLAAGNYHDCMPYEDYDLWLRMSTITEVGLVPEVLLKYRIVPTGVMGGGSIDPKPAINKGAGKNASILFGDMDPSAALKIRNRVAHDRQNTEPAKLRHLIDHRRAAASAALSVGKPPSYFRNTDLYLEQMRFLMFTWLKQHLWGRTVVRMGRSVHRLTSARPDR
ncbi:MAG: glycosyltransferase [Blastocatellia bacterium]|nr:glycosyltransferase [Blastocatellia bacterium]